MDRPSLKQLPRRSLRERVYVTLLEAIVAGDLAPGARVRDEELASELGVSRTPVREALQRLEDEWLVQTFPGSLTRISPLDIRDARDVAPIVAVLHALAIRLAVPRLTAGDLAGLYAAADDLRNASLAGDETGVLAADERFFDLVVRVADNEALRRALDRHQPRLRRLALVHRGTLPGVPFVHQHEEIMLAVERRDANAAASRVEEHWRGLGELLEQAFPDEDLEDHGHDERGNHA